MNKYTTNTDFSKITIYLTLTGYLKAIQRSLDSNYIYYKTGMLNINNVKNILNKLDPIYQLTENSVDKNRRFNLDQATVIIKFFSSGNNDIFFIIMARAGKMGSKNHLFFEREKYQNATDKDHRINVAHYEFVRINKEEYSFYDSKQNKTIFVERQNEKWTLQLTSSYKVLIKSKFKNLLLGRNWLKISQLCFGITKLIAFHNVRKDYYNLKLYMERCFAEICRSDKTIKYRILNDLYIMPDKLAYLKSVNSRVLDMKTYLNIQDKIKDINEIN